MSLLIRQVTRLSAVLPWTVLWPVDLSVCTKPSPVVVPRVKLRKLAHSCACTRKRLIAWKDSGHAKPSIAATTALEKVASKKAYDDVTRIRRNILQNLKADPDGSACQPLAAAALGRSRSSWGQRRPHQLLVEILAVALTAKRTSRSILSHVALRRDGLYAWFARTLHGWAGPPVTLDRCIVPQMLPIAWRHPVRRLTLHAAQHKMNISSVIMETSKSMEEVIRVFHLGCFLRRQHHDTTASVCIHVVQRRREQQRAQRSLCRHANLTSIRASLEKS